MPFTHEQNDEIFNHIYCVLFQCTDENDMIVLSLTQAEITNINDLASLDIDNVMGLQYTITIEDSPVLKDLIGWHKAKIIALLSYI